MKNITSIYIMFWTLVIFILLILALVWLTKTDNKHSLPTVNVDWPKYMGTWYEIARLPVPYQRGCRNSTANYQLLSNGSVVVVNRCQIDGRMVEARGTAHPVGFGQLRIQFEGNTVEGDYNVLYVNQAYNLAIVGTNSKQGLWILSRTPRISPESLASLLALTTRLGYDTSNIIIN